MNRHRKSIVVGAALTALAVAPAGVASASSLLSGYGGPGQGNQAILGSALVNGPRGGSGGGSGESSSSASGSAGIAEASGSEAGAGSGAAAQTGGTTHGTRAGGAAPGRHPGTQARGRAAPASTPTAAELYDAAERNAPAASGGTLGLSGADLVLILLAVVVLALIGALSWRLARVPGTTGSRSGAGG